MESALRPRDIQARIRAGESIEGVARAAGVPPEKLDAFVAPVIAEREHVAGLAQTHPVRRHGETTSHRSLRSAVNEHLASSDIVQNPVWDAWKLEDRRWRVQLTYGPEDARVVAAFVYDQTGRFSVASNEAGRELIGDRTPEKAVRPAAPPAPEANDELALVRAIQSPESADDLEESDELDDETLEAASDGEADMPSDIDDAYEEGELAEVDGVYDIVPSKSSMDVLYDMLSSFDEDSVKIYAGLITPKDAQSSEEALGAAAAEPARTPAEVDSDEDEPVDEPEEEDAEASEEAHAADAEPAVPAEASEPKVVVVEAAQPSLVESEDAENEPTRPLKRSRRRRASVPSWDEIMFGGPTPKGDR